MIYTILAIVPIVLLILIFLGAMLIIEKGRAMLAAILICCFIYWLAWGITYLTT